MKQNLEIAMQHQVRTKAFSREWRGINMNLPATYGRLPLLRPVQVNVYEIPTSPKFWRIYSQTESLPQKRRRRVPFKQSVAKGTKNGSVEWNSRLPKINLPQTNYGAGKQELCVRICRQSKPNERNPTQSEQGKNAKLF